MKIVLEIIDLIAGLKRWGEINRNRW
jgi:hypothetical protein